MFFYVPPSVRCFDSLLYCLCNGAILLCILLPPLSGPFLSFANVPQYTEDISLLAPPPERHSPSEPCFVVLPEFYFDILQV